MAKLGIGGVQFCGADTMFHDNLLADCSSRSAISYVQPRSTVQVTKVSKYHGNMMLTDIMIGVITAHMTEGQLYMLVARLQCHGTVSDQPPRQSFHTRPPHNSLKPFTTNVSDQPLQQLYCAPDKPQPTNGTYEAGRWRTKLDEHRR